MKIRLYSPSLWIADRNGWIMPACPSRQSAAGGALRVKLNLAIGGCSAVAGADGYQRIYLVCAADRSASNNWTSSAIYKAISQVFTHTSTSAFNASNAEYTLDVSGVNQAVDVFFGLVWKQQAAGSTITTLEVELI